MIPCAIKMRPIVATVYGTKLQSLKFWFQTLAGFVSFSRDISLSNQSYQSSLTILLTENSSIASSARISTPHVRNSSDQAWAERVPKEHALSELLLSAYTRLLSVFT